MKCLTYAVLIFFIHSSFSKESIIYIYKRPLYKVNTDYMNVSWDTSNFDNSTREYPVILVNEMRALILKDMPNIVYHFKAQELRTNMVQFDIKLNICTLKGRSFTNIFVRPLINIIENSGGFKLKCPCRKDTLLILKPFNLTMPFLPSIMKPNIEKIFTFTVYVDRKMIPIFTIIVNYMKIEI